MGKMQRRVIVKFKDNVDLPYKDGAEKSFKRPLIGSWNQLKGKYPGITFKRLFISRSPKEIQDFVKRACKRDRSYRPTNFLTYFAIDCPEGVDPKELAQTFSGWPMVQTAYVQGVLGLPEVDYSPGHYPLSSEPDHEQDYLKKAPGGIDAVYAWGKGYNGKDTMLVDLEFGWMIKGWKTDQNNQPFPGHEDLPDNIKLLSGVNQPCPPAGQNYCEAKDYTRSELPCENEIGCLNHGTAILGIVVALDNGNDCVGIAPNAQCQVISPWNRQSDGKPVPNFQDVIMDTIMGMKSGDVLLLELDHDDLPLETDSAVFNSIRTGIVANDDIVIVEAAGNADGNREGVCIDQHLREDSGAIIVGAVNKEICRDSVDSYDYRRLAYWSNYGTRITCYAPGQQLYTLSTIESPNCPPEKARGCFTGTSAAAAVVAGAVLILQNAGKVRLNKPFSPSTIHDMLKDPNNGITVKKCDLNGNNCQEIGSMPDLQKIILNHNNWMFEEPDLSKPEAWKRILKPSLWRWIRLPIPPRPPEPQNKGGRNRPIA